MSITSNPARRLKLGWKDALPDPRTLQLGRYLAPRPALPTPDQSANWVARIPSWPMLANDRVGDCAPVACAHLARAWTGYAADQPADITDEQVLAAYSQISGYDPATGEHDDGCTSLATLNHFRRTGVGGHRAAAYVQVDVTDVLQVKLAVQWFGGLFAAVQLPMSARDQIAANLVWSPIRGDRGRPGSWGGHAIHVGGYRPRFVTCVTWGRTQRMLWGFWRKYVQECYALVSLDWVGQDGQSPSGLNLDALMADLKAITSSQPAEERA
jgi:hypothetical protein